MNQTVRKSAAQWAELVSEYHAGLESERDFCTRHSVKLTSLRKWRYHFKAQAKKNAASASSPFVKVDVRPSRLSQDAAVLCIGADIRLECPVSFDVASLAQLALAVHRGR